MSKNRSEMRALTGLFLFVATTVSAQPQLVLRPIATGLNRPVGIVNAGDSRLFFVLQTGQILIYDGTRVLPTPFLDVSSLVSSGITGDSERGLLGLAFDPRHNGFFFVYYTNTSGNIVLARYAVSSNPDRADATTATMVLMIPHPNFSNHNGGQMQFGPDGLLYIGVGDGGSGGDPNDNAQNRMRLLGKILRIDVSTLPYGLPSSNPFGNEVWAYGLRNPWRFSFDRLTGDLWIADVGQDLWEEVDLQPFSSIGGENYGWRRMEGFHCFNPPTGCQDPTFTMPILEYGHTNKACSITGGYRYHGSQFPRMNGIYFYGDFCNGVISGATQKSDGSWSSQTLLSSHLSITTFGEDQNGELYVADLNGAVYQLTDAGAPPPRRRAVRK